MKVAPHNGHIENLNLMAWIGTASQFIQEQGTDIAYRVLAQDPWGLYIQRKGQIAIEQIQFGQLALNHWDHSPDGFTWTGFEFSIPAEESP